MKPNLSIEGRATRMRFFPYVVLYAGFLVIDYVLANVVAHEWGVELPHGILGLAGAILIAPSAIRRLHDLNLSGYPAALIVIPFVSLLFLATILAWPGTEGENRFGPSGARGGRVAPAKAARS